MRILNKRTEGAARPGCLLPLIAIALLWGGGQGVYTAISNRKPTVLTYDEYVQTKPRAAWLELKDCRLSLPEASYRTGKVGKDIREAFIPVHSASGKEPDKIHVLVATSDQETLGFLNEMNQAQDAASAAKLLTSSREKLFPKRDVKGVVRYGIELKDKDRKQLAVLDKGLADDFIIINEGKEPNLLTSAGMLFGGLLLGFFVVRRTGGTVDSSAPATSPPLPPAA